MEQAIIGRCISLGLIAVTVFLSVLVEAQDLSELPVVARSGNWSVRRSADTMTDEVSCTGFYKDRFDIQLEKSVFYISMRGRGGVSLVTLRFDDGSPKPARLASETERKISTIILEGEEFEELLKSKRLRARIFTILDTVIDEDIDLTGLEQAHTVITGTQCAR